MFAFLYRLSSWMSREHVIAARRADYSVVGWILYGFLYVRKISKPNCSDRMSSRGQISCQMIRRGRVCQSLLSPSPRGRCSPLCRPSPLRAEDPRTYFDLKIRSCRSGSSIKRVVGRSRGLFGRAPRGGLGGGNFSMRCDLNHFPHTISILCLP